MSDQIELPQLVVKTGKSEFRLRCHAAAWAHPYGGSVQVYRRHSEDCPGLLLLSATGPDTSCKSVRATLYEPGIDAEFVLHGPEETTRIVKARTSFGGKTVSYSAAIAKLAQGVIHLVALAQIPGLMPNMSDDHLWTELSSQRYTTPLLRPWTAWLKDEMARIGSIVMAKGCGADVGVLTTSPEELDDLVSKGVRERHLALSV